MKIAITNEKRKINFHSRRISILNMSLSVSNHELLVQFSSKDVVL